MTYRAIKYDHITDAATKMIFHRADLYIADAYSMFYLPYKGWRHGGGCVYTIPLTLLCVIDGIARDIYPTEKSVPEQKKRFTKLLRDKLFWGQPNRGWMEKGTAARMLYVAFRNPLVHQLGRDGPSGHPALRHEPIVGKWGHLPVEKRNIDRIDRLASWDVSWPTMYEQSRDGKRNIKLSAAALYWAVKKMVRDLAASKS